jgi:hypothetical protein
VHTKEQLDYYRTYGFVVFRGLFSKAEMETLRAEFDHRASVASSYQPFDGTEPHGMLMMGDDTPLYASLLEDGRFADFAEEAYGGALGYSTEANRYVGNTYWHYDGAGPHGVGIKFAFYLQGVRAETGALRFIPGSHKSHYHDALGEILPTKYAWARVNVEEAEGAVDQVPGYACEMEPGDVAAFDSRMYHASLGGGVDRHQAAINYHMDPKTPQQLEIVIADTRGYYTERDNSDTPWNPKTGAHPDWLANRGGSPLRQHWIDRMRELSRIEPGQTGYKAVAVHGKMEVVATGD